MYDLGNGTCEIAQKLGIHRTTVQRCLKANGVRLRKRSCANKYNVHFFDEYNKNSCYWAGFIAADGNLRSDRHEVNIHLAISDIDHLQKFANAIEFDGEIKAYGDSCRICLAGEALCNGLANNFSIVPRKTNYVEIPEGIPEEYLPDYLRGYFDGDGCITMSDRNLHISFASGSHKMLEQIRTYFYDRGVSVRTKIGMPSIQKSTSIHYFLKNAAAVLRILYDDSQPENRMDRKYQRYLDWTKSMR